MVSAVIFGVVENCDAQYLVVPAVIFCCDFWRGGKLQCPVFSGICCDIDITERDHDFMPWFYPCCVILCHDFAMFLCHDFVCWMPWFYASEVKFLLICVQKSLSEDKTREWDSWGNFPRNWGNLHRKFQFPQISPHLGKFPQESHSLGCPSGHIRGEIWACHDIDVI